MFCVNCGKEISQGSNFCCFCGFRQPEPAPVAEPVAVVEPAPMAEPVAAVEPAPAAEPIVEPAPMAEPVVAAEPTPVVEPIAEPTPVVELTSVTEPAPVIEPAPEPMLGNLPPVQTPMYGNMQPMQTQPMQMQPMSPIPPAEPKKKKSKAGLIVVILLLVLLLAGGGVFAFLWMNRPITKVASAFAEGDVHKVVELYGKVSEKDKFDVEVQAKEYALGLADSYLNDMQGADYETVSDNLQYLYDNILDGDEGIEDKIHVVEKVYDSRESFKAAEQYQAEGAYAEALGAYANVVSEDKACYEDAQEAIAEIEDTVRENAIAEAEDYVSDSDYDSAKDAIYDALSILPDDEDLMSELAEVEAAEVQEAVNALLADAQDLADAGEYSSAVAMLSDALATYPGHADITKVLATYQEEMYAANPLLGVWEISFDVSEPMAAEVGVDIEVMTIPFIIDLVFEFTEDGEYMITVKEDTFRETIKIWIADYMDYAIDELCEEYGISKDDMEALVQNLYGISLKEYLEEELAKQIDVDEVVDETVSTMETYGVYETEGNKLYLSETYIDYSHYDYYSVEGNTLTISLPEGQEFDSGIPGLEYPFTLTRVQ